MLAFYHNFQGWLPESDIASLFDSPPPSRPKLVETRRFIAPPAGLWNLRPNQRVLNPIIPHSIYMYRIFTYMSHKNQPNLGKYTLLVPWESVMGIVSGQPPKKNTGKSPRKPHPVKSSRHQNVLFDWKTTSPSVFFSRQIPDFKWGTAKKNGSRKIPKSPWRQTFRVYKQV